MPAMLTHHLFGRSVLARSNNQKFATRDARDAFLLGNQGPDPLFYATRSFAMAQVKTLGSRMHDNNENIVAYLEAWRGILDHASALDHEREILEAYISGFLCHFALDRTAHPLVFAYEHAICHAGVEGLKPEDRSCVHGQIETDLDTFMLYQLTGRTIGEYYIPKQVLYSSKAALALVDRLYRAAACVYGMRVPRDCFSLGVRDMRTAVKLLYSPGGTKRKTLGFLERAVRPHSLLQAMSHYPQAASGTWLANEEHATWLHPETRKESNSSFKQLFDEALDTAVYDEARFAEGVPIAKITGGLNFSGNSKSKGGV